MDMRSSIFDDYRIKSIYIGGGTPTYLNFEALSKLLTHFKRYGGNNVEYTCEANPGTLTYDKLELLKESGVNRLSIGLQSWDNNILRYLGRIHRVEDFVENYSLARDIGFDNINVDLMSSIQGQTMEILSSTLDNLISLKPEHISCYSLIIEEGTVFGERYKVILVQNERYLLTLLRYIHQNPARVGICNKHAGNR
jgi:oxygen-independent coproporphyrinogen-3 oxidase